jgi:hypothetical protein
MAAPLNIGEKKAGNVLNKTLPAQYSSKFF